MLYHYCICMVYLSISCLYQSICSHTHVNQLCQYSNSIHLYSWTLVQLYSQALRYVCLYLSYQSLMYLYIQPVQLYFSSYVSQISVYVSLSMLSIQISQSTMIISLVIQYTLVYDILYLSSCIVYSIGQQVFLYCDMILYTMTLYFPVLYHDVLYYVLVL